MPKWKQFERIVCKIQKELSPHAEVVHDETIIGRSGASNQCDVVVRSKIGQYDFLCIIECKDWSEKIGVDVVRSFRCKIEDTEAMKGVIVSAKGFTKDARLLAKNYNINLYTLIDAGHVDWRKEALIPIVVTRVYLKDAKVSTVNSATGEPVSLVDANGNFAPPDKTYFYEEGSKKYIPVKLFIEQQWDRILSERDIPSESEVFTTENNEYRLFVGENKFIPINIIYSITPELVFYYGYLSLDKCQGLVDQETKEILTSEFISTPLNFKKVVEEWQSTNTKAKIPFKPLEYFWMAQFFSPRKHLPPDAVIIHHKKGNVH